MEVTKEQAEKVLSIVDAGLVDGIGNPVPGQMCIQAAVCYAFDLPHGDRPTCVGSAVRSYVIRLNDARWASDAERTENLRKLSIAQLGSDSIDQRKFADLVVDGAGRKIVPIALRFAAEKNPSFAEELEAAAKKCEQAEGKENLRQAVVEARGLAYEVRKAADAYADAYAYAAAAYAAADAAGAYAAAYAAYAAAGAYAADAADAADAYAYAADAAYRLKVLQAAVEVGLDALIKCESPGVAFLDLCEVKK